MPELIDQYFKLSHHFPITKVYESEGNTGNMLTLFTSYTFKSKLFLEISRYTGFFYLKHCKYQQIFCGYLFLFVHGT